MNIRPSVFMRTLLATLVGVVGRLSISTSYSIWYVFPKDFAMGELIGQTVGWFVSGLGIAVVLGKCGCGAAVTPGTAS